MQLVACSLQPDLHPASCILSRVSSRSGQALLELAIFGSLIILMLGLMVSYGMNADYQQRGQMEVFRSALQMTAESLGSGGLGNEPTYRPSGSVTIVRDRHVPDPSHPFGVGSVVPVAASASVTRSYQLHLHPETANDLPRTRLTIQDRAFNCTGSGCTTAGFRTETGVSIASQERYSEVYGVGQVCWSEKCGASTAGCAPGSEVTSTDPDTGQVVTICETPIMNIVIIDSCMGEMMSYSGCVSQARMIVDSGACEDACYKSDPSGVGRECNVICAQPMQVPWYAQGAASLGGGQWNFPNLQALFTDTAGRIVHAGIQPSPRRVTQQTHQMRKTESPSTIVTETSGSTRQDTERDVIWTNWSSGTGQQVTTKDTNTKDVETKSTWTVNW